MFHLTKQERIALLSLALVLFLGTVLRYVFQKYPEMKDIVNFADSDSVYDKVNINAASADELEAIPYIGKMTARNIIDFRERNGKFMSIEDLKKVKGIRDKNYQIFSKYVKVR